MAQNNEDGRYGEIANQGGVVIQTQQDMKDLADRVDVNPSDVISYPGIPATTDNSVCRIDINDLVFTVGYNKGGTRGKLNNAIPVSSNVNGLFISKLRAAYPLANPNDEEEQLQSLSETIRVLGQALGGTNPIPDSPAYLKVNFTTRAQGSAHITNTGDEVLNPGDTILWDLFRKNEIMDVTSTSTGTSVRFSDEWKSKMGRFGFNLKKVPLKLTKLSHSHVSFEKSLLTASASRADALVKSRSNTAQGKFANAVLDFVAEFLFLSGTIKPNSKTEAHDDSAFKSLVAKAMAHGTPASQAQFNDSINKLIKGIMYFVNDLDRRKVGKALSFAKPGKGVDVLLGAS
jgi:hypothetical protein